MKRKRLLFILLIPTLFLGIIACIHFFSQTATSENIRPTVQFTINTSNVIQQPINVGAKNLPEFIVDLTAQKFKDLLKAPEKQIPRYVKATIVHEVLADAELESEINIDKEKQKLIVHPKDIPNFKPGKYKLSLQLRTLEGEIDIDQDFTWGVLVINTNKSTYTPGENVKISMGVLNNRGQTQCMNGVLNKVDEVKLTIADPTGKKSNFSSTDGTIRDSGKCGATTVTNEADFQATYTSGSLGIYQMHLEATVHGEKRELDDYFKVDNQALFDVERTSFPTRIYPPTPYPVSFTITSPSDFQGQIVDIVPANFVIDHISDKGITQAFGEFIKIVWQVELSANTPKTFNYFIKFPHISPEFYLLGPITIGDFREARQWQIASDAIASTTGVAAYEDNNGQYTHYQIWDGTQFLGEQSMSSGAGTPQDSRWFKEVSSPKTGEKLVGLFDNNNDGERIMYMYRWDGSAWNLDFTIDPATNWPDGYTRFFDVCYEELSGDAIFIYSDTSNQLYYRKRVSGTWDVSDSSAGTGMDSRKRWVEARARFNTDQILVAYINDNERIGALIWDGSTNTFGNQFDDDDSPAQTEVANSQDEPFGVAWESASGTPMIFWGSTGNDILYREFTGGAWSGESTLYSGYPYDVAWLSVAADPVSTSNNIALAIQEAYDTDTTDEVVTCRFGVWTGSGVIAEGSTITCRSDDDQRLNAVAFENNSSKAVWVYSIREGTSGTTGNSIAWRTWTSSGGYSSSTTESDNLSGNIESVQVNSDLLTTSMIALTADSAGDLNYHSWDGSDWVTNTTDLNSNIQGTEENAEAYGFGFDRNLETVAAYRWFANNNGTDVGSALTSQDIDYTLTSANQEFRLRIIMYYPDSVALSGRQYKLQYVDRGSGTCESPSGSTPSTWTDVPTSGGQINFNNNSSPADGDNLTANAADPTYRSYTVRNQDYEEANNFTNSVTAISGDEVGKWDFSLIDNTTYDRTPQTFCFRVARSTNNLSLQMPKYPQMTTAAVADVLIQGGSNINGGTQIQ